MNIKDRKTLKTWLENIGLGSAEVACETKHFNNLLADFLEGKKKLNLGIPPHIMLRF